MPFNIVRQDISRIEADAIVSPTRPGLSNYGGAEAAILSAGGPELLKARESLGSIPTGQLYITPAFSLHARIVVHISGPRWNGTDECEKVLLSCYTDSLNAALAAGSSTVAVPLISSGALGFPPEISLRVSTEAIKNFLADNDMQVTLVVFDKNSFSISRELFGQIDSYIDDNYSVRYRHKRNLSKNYIFADLIEEDKIFESSLYKDKKDKINSVSLEEKISDLDASFSETLLQIIDEKGMTDPQVYKRANIDRKLFSKIRSNTLYRPSKNTAVSLCIALELSREETDSLLKKAGYALSDSSVSDVIVCYFIDSGNYDIFEINEALFAYDQPILGSMDKEQKFPQED